MADVILSSAFAQVSVSHSCKESVALQSSASPSVLSSYWSVTVIYSECKSKRLSRRPSGRSQTEHSCLDVLIDFCTSPSPTSTWRCGCTTNVISATGRYKVIKRSIMSQCRCPYSVVKSRRLYMLHTSYITSIFSAERDALLCFSFSTLRFLPTLT